MSVLTAILLPGCDDDDGGGTGSGVLTRDALIGTWAWSDGANSESYELRGDGTMTYDYTDEEGSASYEGAWSVTGGVLETSIGETGTDGDVTYTWEETYASRAAIVGDVLYLYGAGVRTSGSGSSLDGTWEFEESEVYSETETGPAGTYTENGGAEYEETVIIDGSAFESTWREREYEELTGDTPSDIEESGTTSGTIRVEGDAIYVTVTEEDGTPIPSSEQAEEFLGHRAAPNVIVASEEGVSLDDLGYQRQ
jgi:hypothetical protein